MNRNTNAHFSEIPNVEISRSVMDRSFSHKFSGNVGDVIPIFVDPDIMPGDTVQMDTSKVVRFQTLLTPMMDNIYADIYWFFVPHRLVWDHWINFMGENTSSAWTPDVTYSVPVLKVPKKASTNNNHVGSILDYLGFPVEMNTVEVSINALPVRAYAKICQDWFISENLSDPINIYTGDSAVTATTSSSYIDDIPHGGAPFKAAKFQDYFTSALPSPQKGDAVNISIGFPEAFPVVSLDHLAIAPQPYTNGLPTIVQGQDNFYRSLFRPSGTGSQPATLSVSSSSFDTCFNSALGDTENSLHVSNLFAVSDQLGAFSVNDMRYAFQLQKLLERDARGGTRYIEIIKSHFGVQSPDARLQRSEYLGGNRFGITVNQVSNTAQSEQDFLGDLGAFSVTSDVHSDFTRSFTEHGTLMCVMVLRYDHTYCQGLSKFWSRRNRFDYYWPVFANIGEQPIMKQEIFLSDGTYDPDNPGDHVFGYNEAWADYRYFPNRVSGELRPYVQNGLASWTLADDYSAEPSLSDSWIREDKANVDRVLAVTSSVSNQFWADVYFSTKYTRPMPMYSIPGLIDHH